MGEFAVPAAGFCYFCALVCMIMSLFLPQHTAAFFVGFGVVKFMRITIGFTWLDFEVYPVCSQFEFCEPYIRYSYDDSSHDIQGLAERFCTHLTKHFFPDGCSGYSNAHWMGIIAVLIKSVSVMALLVSCGFIYLYYTTFKPTYRKGAAIAGFTACGAGLLAINLYYFFVLWSLGNMRMKGVAAPITGYMLNTSENSGVSFGFFISWLGLLLMGFGAACVHAIKVPEEDMLLYAKEEGANMGANAGYYGAAGQPQTQEVWEEGQMGSNNLYGEPGFQQDGMYNQHFAPHSSTPAW